MRSIALLAAALTLAAPASAAVTGEQRILLVNVTWGPEPWTVEHARASLDEAARYVRSASFGRTWIVGDTTPWLRALPSRPPGCELEPIRAAADAAAARAGFDPARYTKVAYAFPEIGCSWGGAYFPPGIWANGYLSRALIAHELGHTYGVTEEGPALACAGGRCETRLYGNPYSVMGHGLGDFGAWEKFTFGWLDDVARPAAEVVLGAIDRESPQPRALRVVVAADEYWLEYRPPAPVWDPGDPAAQSGVVVHAGPNDLGVAGARFAGKNLLLLDPAGLGRPALRAGETVAVAGAFSVSVTAADAETARLRFRWLDRTRPAAPRVSVRVRGRRADVTWSAPRDTGSGVARYDLSLDGRRLAPVAAVREVAGTLAAAFPERALGRLGPGLHRLTVTAVDRAGNRGAAGATRFRVR